MKLSIKKLNLIMAEKTIPVKEVLEKAEISNATFSRMKAGTQEPRPQTLGKIARALGVKVEDLLED